jgi:peptide chain release factor 2
LLTKQKRIDEINSAMAQAGFWGNQEKAQGLVTELQQLQLVTKPLKALLSAADDVQVLLEFAKDDTSSDSERELTQLTGQVEQQLAELELQEMMSAPEDACGAYVQVQAGEGGTDAADWAEMLMRMYLRWAENHGYAVEELDRSPGEEAGIRNATYAIRGDYVYGHLKGENGVHRLIRISPFDAAARRQTSFAAVDVTPEVDENVEIDIDWEKDVRVDTYRSGGAGGQKVNKTDSAVRLTHIPTGVVAACQNERSQQKNRSIARKMLIAKLYQIEREKREAESAAKRGSKTKIGFGGEPVRHYVLNPDQFVKDARTGLRVGNPNPVLDGEIDEFLEAYLRWKLGRAV